MVQSVLLATIGLLLGVRLASASEPEPGASAVPQKSAAQHWAFQPLKSHVDPKESKATLDSFIGRRLKEARLTPARPADRATLIRRVAFILTGLPPTPDEIGAFLSDKNPGAYRRMYERYLTSARYGERWGKHWLDAAGYADSNGYFNADTDRPLAYRYRDYVIRSLNRDKPFDQFVREQLAGDELAGWKSGQVATPEVIALLEATHFLRNGQDGSGESDGNPDEVRTDRYYALESEMQIIASSLLGVTMQCAKCHDHKFEPITQKDYYAFQAVLYPAFNIEKWVKPNDRAIHANPPGEMERWTENEKRFDGELAALKQEFQSWVASNRISGRVLFQDRFEATNSLISGWANVAPHDDGPAGSPAVNLDSKEGPAARTDAGTLQIIEGGGSGDRWLCTQESFDWRPAGTGQWIQVTFDLVATRFPDQERSAERIGYLIAAHDFNDNSTNSGGNILIDGNPGGATTVHVDYPGADSKSRGSIGGTGYKAGHNYGVRITRSGSDDFSMEHLVDGAVDGAALKFKHGQLTPGAFAFEYCCGRSFVVDNVVVEKSDDDSTNWLAANGAFQKSLAEKKQALDKATKAIAAKRNPKPGRISWMTDGSTDAPEVHLLKRGNHKTPGETVEPDFPTFLQVANSPGSKFLATKTATTTGRRLAWANWLTEPGSSQASLLARVTVNRVWQQYFAVGIVSTPDNLGLSGAEPTHPELLSWLAVKFVESGWSLKALHRLILESATFQQSSTPRGRALERDPDNRLLWRYPLHRLDAEAIRDAMLVASGRLGSKTNGAYVPTPRNESGEIIVDESKPDGFCRSIFLQQRRTQVPTFLGTFDAPSVVFNCTRRPSSTMPLQSLSLLNSDFAVKRGEDLARRLEKECGVDAESRIRRAFLLACGREPDSVERKAALGFISKQRLAYAAKTDVPADARAWSDFCQSLFGHNAFLYLE